MTMPDDLDGVQGLALFSRKTPDREKFYSAVFRKENLE